MKNKKLPLILISTMVAWIIISLILMFVEKDFTGEYIFMGIKAGAMTDIFILFAVGNYISIKRALAGRSRAQIRKTGKRNVTYIFRFLVVSIIVGVFAACILLVVCGSDFTAANIAVLTLAVVIILFILTGILEGVKTISNLNKKHGIGAVILIIVTILMLFIKYQK